MFVKNRRFKKNLIRTIGVISGATLGYTYNNIQGAIIGGKIGDQIALEFNRKNLK